MKILIVGSDLNAVLIARYLKLQDENNDIFVTTNEHCEFNSYTPLKISENDISSLVDFVKYNQIEFTIVTSLYAIINSISDIFKKEGFPVLAPFSEAARVTFFNSIAKKIMYKLKINTPKFAIFDRENLAIDYIRNAKFPLIIQNDFVLQERNTEYFDTFIKAKNKLQKIFENGIEKIIIQNYIDIEPVYLYFITDGFNAIPFIALEKNVNSVFTEIKTPSQKISDEMIIKILRNAVYPLLDDISKFIGGYVGILGLKVKIKKDSFYVLEFYNGFQDYDLQGLLSVLDDNLINIFFDAATGCLADNHEYINFSDKFSYTIAINKKYLNLINNNNEEDFIQSEDKNNIIFTNTASTFNYSEEILMDYIKTICDKEIYKNIIDSKQRREIKI